MRYVDLTNTILEAQRFLEKAKALLAEEKKFRKETNDFYKSHMADLNVTGTPSAAVKRASLDLSKELAKLRR
jgi:hypothetical protein